MSQPQEKLVRAIGTFGLAAGIVNITIGGGIFRLPANVAGSLGASAPLAYLVCAAAMGLIVLCIADAGRRVSLTGGPYAYVGSAFGPFVGFLSGVLLFMLGTFATAAVSTVFSASVGQLVPALASPIASTAVLVAAFTFWSLVNLRGVALGVRLNSIATVAKLLPLLLVAIGGAFFISTDNLRVAAMPVAGDVARTSLLLIFAFAGIECALVPSGEVRDTARTVPRAIAIAMVTITALYIMLQVVAQGVLGDALAQSTAAPLADTAGASMGGWARSILLAGASISTFGYLGGMTLSMPRMLFALARDGFLPKVLTTVHPENRAPQIAIIVQSVLTLALAVSGTFEQLAILANVSALALYLGCALASWRLRGTGVAVVPLLAIAVIGWLLTGLQTMEWVGFVLCLAAASLIYVLAKQRLAPALVVLAALVGAGSIVFAQPGVSYDILIRGGRVLDGTGNPWFPADIGITDGRIAAVGSLTNAQAARVIDAAGKYVSPGFIDIHSHADDGSGPRGGFRDADPIRRSAPNLVSQGITTVVVNQDGRSPWPLAEQLAQLRQNGIGPNAMLLVGHGTVRRRVMGDAVQRPARADEVTRMRALVKQALQEGAVGMSAGLEYEPGRWSTTDEVVELARELPAVQGVYISHERSEGSDPMWYWPSQDGPTAPSLLDAVRETIEIGEKTGARVVASHLKAKGEHYWGSSAAAVTLIQRARDRGVDVWADQYPYPTSGTDGNTVLIPAWAIRPPGVTNQQPQNRAAMLKRVLGDPPTAKLVRTDIAHEIRRRGGAENITVYEFTDKSLYGKSLAEIARLWKLDPIETAIKIQIEGLDRNGGARMRGFSMAEIDMELIAKQPWVATSTDAGIAMPGDGPATHARFYGSFPRKIRHYALDRGAISLEHAIRSSTSLPARIMRLTDRGEVRAGMAADIVVFDLAAIRDKATFFDPHQYSEGIDYVLVNGVAVVDGGKLTGERPGRVLTR